MTIVVADDLPVSALTLLRSQPGWIGDVGTVLGRHGVNIGNSPWDAARPARSASWTWMKTTAEPMRWRAWWPRSGAHRPVREAWIVRLPL